MAVLLRDELVVGYVWWKWSGSAGEILYLWLDTPFRGRGRMRKLFQWWCQQHKFSCVRTKAGNSLGRPWLERNGFRQSDSERDWELVFSRTGAHADATAI